MFHKVHFAWRRPAHKTSKLWRVIAVRHFAYEDTFAFRVHGPKKVALVIHPVLPGADQRKRRSEIIWDAEEALGLARANRWDVLPGPNREPRGGWDMEGLAEAERLDAERQAGIAQRTAHVPEGWHLDRGEEESDDEFDIHEGAWKSGVVKRQWAETCILRVRYIDPKTLFARGKLEELALYVAQNPCDYVFVNTTLTPSQSMNMQTIFCNAVAASLTNTRREEGRGLILKKAPELEVMDRNRLVLEIFQTRASTAQAKLQVSLARLEYMKTRMVMNTPARLKKMFVLLHEEVGPYKELKGTQNNVQINYEHEVEPFDTERSMLRQLEARLKKALDVEKKAQQTRRSGRAGVPTLGIVGYTNAGKTSLMNRLTNAELKERDLLFQTLDTTLRRVKLPSGGHAIIADSIGFIQNLPHNLFAAFESTLSELVSCDVLIHVRDIAHPQRDMQKDTVLTTLRSAGVPEEKLERSLIEVWNKIDLLPREELEALLSTAPEGVIPVCAADGMGIEELRDVLDTVCTSHANRQCRTFRFPEANMQKALKYLYRHGVVHQDTLSMTDDGLYCIDAILPHAAWRSWEKTGLSVEVPGAHSGKTKASVKQNRIAASH